MIGRDSPRIRHWIGIAMTCLLAPVSAWSEEESLPSAADGQEVIVGRIAGLPLSHGLDGVYPDYQANSMFDANGG